MITEETIARMKQNLEAQNKKMKSFIHYQGVEGKMNTMRKWKRMRTISWQMGFFSRHLFNNICDLLQHAVGLVVCLGCLIWHVIIMPYIFICCVKRRLMWSNKKLKSMYDEIWQNEHKINN